MKIKNSNTHPPTDYQFNWRKCCEKMLVILEDKKTRGKLTVTAFSTHLMGSDGGGRRLFSCLPVGGETVGGQPSWPIE